MVSFAHSRFLRRLQCSLRFLNRASVRLFLVLCSRLAPPCRPLPAHFPRPCRPRHSTCRVSAPTPACSAHSSCTVRISNTPTLAFAACPVSGRVLRASLCGHFVFRVPSRSFDRSSISARATRRSFSLPSPFCTMSVASSRLPFSSLHCLILVQLCMCLACFLLLAVPVMGTIVISASRISSNSRTFPALIAFPPPRTLVSVFISTSSFVSPINHPCASPRCVDGSSTVDAFIAFVISSSHVRCTLFRLIDPSSFDCFNSVLSISSSSCFLGSGAVSAVLSVTRSATAAC